MTLSSILFLIGTSLEYSHVLKNKGKVNKRVAAFVLSPVMLALISVRLIFLCFIILSLVLLLRIFKVTKNPRHVSLILFQVAGFLALCSSILDSIQIEGAWEFSYLTTIIFAAVALTMPVVAYFEQILVNTKDQYHMSYYRAELYKDLFAHDISNILQYIKSSTDIFKLYQEDPHDKETIKRVISILDEQTIRGSNLVRNIHKLSELTEEENILKRKNLLSYVLKNIDYIKKSYSNREIFIALSPTSGEFYIMANEMFLLIGENILINAIKYNGNDIIDISIEISPVEVNDIKYFKLEFKDNGIGIPDERKKTLFEDIGQKKANKRGMGLGLLLVKRILDKFNGKIWVENIVEGEPAKGSNFIVLIPEAE